MKVVKVRKEHMCAFCGEDIDKGEQAKTEVMKYQRASGCGFYWDTYYYHMNCPMEIRS